MCFCHTSSTDRSTGGQLSLVEPIDDESVSAEARVAAGDAPDFDHVCTRIGVIEVFIPVDILISVAAIYPSSQGVVHFAIIDRPIQIHIVILTDWHIEQLNLKVFIKPDHAEPVVRNHAIVVYISRVVDGCTDG